MTGRHRTSAMAVAALLVLAGLLAACGSDRDASSTSAPSTTEASGSDDGAAAEGTFPATVEHAFGTTEVTEAPKRVVSVGYTEQDTLLALGVVPVAITDWYGDQPYGTWPWAQDLLGDAKPELLDITDGFQYERIAALKPDLIVGTNAGMDEEAYDKLSQIAPTIASPEGADGYFSDWDDQTILIGEALGRKADAEQLVDDVKVRYADAAEAHPEWKGKQVVFLQNAFYEGSAIAYQDGLSTDFLTDLGFEIPSELDAYQGEEDGSQAYIPVEKLDVLDVADLLIWGTEKPEDRTELEKEPLYGNLEEVKDGNLVFTDGTTAGAIYFTSPLSLPYVLDQLVPALEQVLDDGKGPATIGS